MPEASIRNVIVTGAASGVGAATVSTLLGRGYAVHAFVRDPSSAAIGTGAVVPRMLACDISDPFAVESAVDDVALHAAGELHGVVHCAAISMAAPVELTTSDDMRRILETNVIGSLSLIRAVMPLLRRSRGRLVAVSSLSGRVSMPLQGAYCASKAALEALLDTLRREVAGQGVTVSIIQPGGIRTRMAVVHAREVAARMSRLSAEDSDNYRVIYQAHQRLVGAGRERSIDPLEVVKSIVHALESPHPRIRYKVGGDARELLRRSRTLSDRRMDEYIDGLHRT